METNTTSETQCHAVLEAMDEFGNELPDMTDWPTWTFVIVTGQGWACGNSHEECLKKIRSFHGGFRKNQTPYNLIGFTEPVKGFYVEMFRYNWHWADVEGGLVQIGFNGWDD